MARRLSISPAYVNLLENNQRSLSVQVLMALTEAYGIDGRSLVQDNEASQLADLRALMRDPLFAAEQPDLTELRAAVDHAPRLVARLVQLYQAHRSVVDQVKRLAGSDAASSLQTLRHPKPRSTISFAITEIISTGSNAQPRQSAPGSAGRMTTCTPFSNAICASSTTSRPRCDASATCPDVARLRSADITAWRLSEALDHTNRIFQLAHVLGLVEAAPIVESLATDSGIETEAGLARLRVELTNYFAAALLMPYDEVLSLAQETDYDIDRIAAAFGVSFEQVCHRLTTLQRDGARGIPFFFLRVDRAGNVTKRFNATAFTLAEEGGACPVWDLHGAFRMPGMILPQFVELPDGAQFFTISRTTDRPVFSRQTQDRRLVVAIGCEHIHAERIGYSRPYNLDGRRTVQSDRHQLPCLPPPGLCPTRASATAYEPAAGYQPSRAHALRKLRRSATIPYREVGTVY